MSNMLDDIEKYGKELVFLKLKEVAGWVVATILAVILLLVSIAVAMDRADNKIEQIECDNTSRTEEKNESN